MHLTDEELLAEHKEEQRQKREDERLRAARRHELKLKIFSEGGFALLGGIVGALCGVLLSAIVVKITDTDGKKIERLERGIRWCNEANRRLSESAK